MPDFAPVLRTCRLAAGLTQESLAEASGVSVEAIRALEGGRRRHPRAVTVDLLVDALKLTPAQIEEMRTAASRPAKARAPHRLPPDIEDFSGRATQVESLSKLLTASANSSRTVVISAIAGMGGVGKTTLAIHTAHQVSTAFPDGQLYVDLRGFGPGEPMTVQEALTALLKGLGFVPGRTSAPTDVIAARYRSALSGRRMLILLDNAANARQVLPLLPGTPECAVVVTSREHLTALPGVAHLSLDVMDDDEGLRFLADLVGQSRVDHDVEAAREIVQLCGGLPLALRIAGARLAADPDWTVADLRTRLSDRRERLELLSGPTGESGLRACLALSLQDGQETTRIFPWLGLFEGDELDLKVAARLTNLSEEAAEPLLERLVDMNLLEVAALGRYRFHDLVRAFARELADEQLPAADQAAARLRVLQLYRATAWRLRDLTARGELSDRWREDSWTEGAEHLDDIEEINDWIDAEWTELRGTLARSLSGTKAERAAVAPISAGLNPHFIRRHRYVEWHDSGLLALKSLDGAPDPIAHALITFDLGLAYCHLEEFAPGIAQLQTALRVSEPFGAQAFRQNCLVNLAHFLDQAGRWEEGLDYAKSSLELALERENPVMETLAYQLLGALHGHLGDPARQDQYFEQTLATAHRQDFPDLIGLMFQNIGISYRDTGRPELGLVHLREAHRLLAEDAKRMVLILDEEAMTELVLGELEPAETHLTQALDLASKDHNRYLEARNRHHLAQVLLAAGRKPEALGQLEKSLDLFLRLARPEADAVRELLLRSSS